MTSPREQPAPVAGAGLDSAAAPGTPAGPRTLTLWSAALAATALLAALTPLPRTDPLATTLLIVPGVAAALIALGRRVGVRVPPRRATTETAVLATLVLLTIARPALGMAAAEILLAAGFALLLAHRVGRLLPALVRALDRPRPSRWPPAAFFLIPLVVYLAILPWSHERRPPNGDEPYYLIQAHSLAYDLDVELSNNYAAGDSLRFMTRRIEPQPGDPTGPGGAVYSRHTMTLPLLLAPVYRLAGVYGALGMMAVMTAALAWATLALALSYYPDRARGAARAWAIAAFSPPLLLYSHQVWVEVPAALLAVVGLLGVARLNRDGAGSRAGWAAAALAALLMALLKLRFALLAGPLVLLAWWRGGRSRKALLAVAGLGVGGLLALLAYNQLTFGNPLKIHRWESIVGLVRRPYTDYLRGALGLFFDNAFGLAGAAPVWLLLIPALARQLRRRERPLADFALLSTVYLVFLTPRLEWNGGWSPPFRYGLVLLPFLAVQLVPLLSDRLRPVARLVLMTAVALTLAVTLVWVVEPNWTYNFADGRSHPLDALSAQTQSDFARFFPSYVRWRTASWIWPALCVLALPAMWNLRSRRRLPGTAVAPAMLLAAAVLVVAAGTVPTRVVEIEDRWVRKQGGELYPERWTRSRVQYDGGWVLAPGSSAVAAVNPGGVTLQLVLEVDASLGGALVRAHAGGREIAAWRLEAPAKGVFAAPPAAWAAGARDLRLTVDPLGAAAADPAVRIDRLRLRWEGAATPVGEG